jgi:hypothetical protein
MQFNKERFDKLKESYEKVGKKILEKKDFDSVDLESSVLLFEGNSIAAGNPEPLQVDVFAVLSGISFDQKFLEYTRTIQVKIHEIIVGTRFYLVEPENLGIEYAVLKWPNGVLGLRTIEQSIQAIQDIKLKSFHLNVFGIQIHEDGCIILKGIDECGSLFRLRENVISNVAEIPDKQSEWAHVPLGRILSPIGESRMSALKKLIVKIDQELNYHLLIDSVHLVHEKQWYMKQKEYLFTKNLPANIAGC